MVNAILVVEVYLDPCPRDLPTRTVLLKENMSPQRTLLGQMDFYPIPGKCRGPAIDLTGFSTDVAYNLDFNAMPKDTGGGVVFRGAYAGEGTNPGWQLQLGIKP